MKTANKVMLCAGMAASIASVAFARPELYNNGVAKGGLPPYGISTTATHSTGAAAPAGFVWSELQINAALQANNTFGFGAQFTTTNRLADDFTIPAGQTWTISEVSVFHYLTGGATVVNQCSLQIWDRKPDLAGAVLLFGDATTNRFTLATAANTYRTARTAPPGTTRSVFKADIACSKVLGPGTYWIDFQAATNGGGFCPPAVKPGSVAVPGANAMQFTTAWAPAYDVGNPLFPAPGEVQDFPFIITGTSVVAPSCYADCDGVGGLTGNDFQCFLNKFVANDTYADCDGVGGLTGNDFQCFLDKYVAGCS